MTEKDRIKLELQVCQDYQGPDMLGALIGELDWQAELSLLEERCNETYPTEATS